MYLKKVIDGTASDGNVNTARLTPYGNNPAAAGTYHAVRGIRLYCETYGRGESLLLIYGNGGSLRNFAKTIPYFTRQQLVLHSIFVIE